MGDTNCAHPDEALSPSHFPGGWCNACGAFRMVPQGVETYLGDVRPLKAEVARLRADLARALDLLSRAVAWEDVSGWPEEQTPLWREEARAVLANHDQEATNG